MKTYARIDNGVVAELLHTDKDIRSMFNPALVWVDVSAQPEVTEGWSFDGSHFAPPSEPAGTEQAPTITELQVQLTALSARIAALASRN
jgi:hypothetical protein